TREQSICNHNWVCPVPKTVLVDVTPKADGTFIEAMIDMNDPDDPNNPSGSLDQNPTGITPVKAKAQGTFFFAIGTSEDPNNINRVAFLRLPLRQKVKHPRDDDDQDDGWTGDKPWHKWHGHA